ncbi:MAG: hypothetical protein JWO86_4802 [Myxococcaceae bacterium]|nr:hypothetical protein [Myxococcaceae bacterium]
MIDDKARSPSSPALSVEEEAAEVSRAEHGALKCTALAAVIGIGWLIMPIGVGIPARSAVPVRAQVA